MNKIDIKQIIKNSIFDLITAIGICICILLMDRRFTLFLINLALLLALVIGLSIYKVKTYKKYESNKKELESLLILSLLMDKSNDMEDLLKNIKESAYDLNWIIEPIEKGDLELLLQDSRNGQLAKNLIEEFKKENRAYIKETSKEISIKLNESVNSYISNNKAKNLGLLMVFIASLPLAFTYQITIFNKAFLKFDWLYLVLRLIVVLLFMYIELISFKEMNKKGD